MTSLLVFSVLSLFGVSLEIAVLLASDASYTLAAMVMGAVVANLAKHHERPFHTIEGVEWPFLIRVGYIKHG